MGEGRIISASKWVTLTTLVTSAIGMITTLLLPRLLAPEDFGLFALGSLITSLAFKLSGLGQGEYVIHCRKDEERVMAVAFTSYLFTSIFFFILQIIMAKTLSVFFNNNRLIYIYFWMAWGYLITAFSLISNSILSKELRFDKKFWPEVFGAITYTIVALILAIMGKGVWALVFSSLSSNLIIMLGLWLASGWRPKIYIYNDIMKQILSYGLPLMANGLLVYLWFSIDRFFIGKVLDAKQLGFYALAFQFAYLLPMKITQIISTVSFPVYSALEEWVEKRREIFRRSFNLTCYLAGLIAMLTYYLSEPFIFKMYGSDWKLTAEAMKVWSFFSFASIVSAPLVSLLMSLGKTRVIMYSTLIGLTIALILITQTVSLGIINVAKSMTISIYIYLFALYIYLSRYLLKNKIDLILPAISSLFLFIVLITISHVAKKYIYGSGIIPLPTITVSALLLILIYSVFNISLNRELRHDLFVWIKR